MILSAVACLSGENTEVNVEATSPTEDLPETAPKTFFKSTCAHNETLYEHSTHTIHTLNKTFFISIFLLFGCKSTTNTTISSKITRKISDYNFF